MTSPRLDAAVVICAYTDERWDALEAAVSSVASQTRPARETVVVVDHNADLFRRLRATFSHLRVVENRGVRGLAAARNVGIAATTAPIVAFLDDDAMADPEWLDRLLKRYEDADVVGVGGSIAPLWEQGRPRGFPKEFDWVVGCTYRGMPEHRTDVRNLIGANMSFRRDAFERAGGFESGIGRVGTRPVGCEETDFCIRASRAIPNGKIVYDPSAKVVHRVPRHRAGWRYFRARCYAEGLSKAAVAHRVGAGAGLASERTHALRQLPRAVFRGIGDALTGDPFGLVRAVAVVAGLIIATAGFVVGMIGPTRAVAA